MAISNRIEGLAGGGRGPGGITGRARANSAAAANAVAPKKSTRPVVIAKRVTLPGQIVKINSNPKPVVVPAVPLPRSVAGIVGEGAKRVNPVYQNGQVVSPQLRAATNKALANSAKGKTQTPTAEAARSKALKEKETIAKKSAQEARLNAAKRAF